MEFKMYYKNVITNKFLNIPSSSGLNWASGAKK